MPPFLSTPFILHSVTTSRTSNTHQLVVGMTVHEILDMVAYVHMYAWYTLWYTYICMLVYASGLQYMFIDVHWYSTIHHRDRGLLSTMPVKVVIMTL